MTAEQQSLLRSSFDRAVDFSPDQRLGFLNELRDQDPEVAQELDQLLSAHGRKDSILDAPAVIPTILLQQVLAEGNSEQRGPILAAGALIGERYEVLGALGEGGFGRVYTAADRRLDHRKVVLKVSMHPAQPWFEERFQDEVRALSRLDHPGIVGVFDSGTLDDGSPYVVMRFVPGQSLEEILSSGPLSQEQALTLLRQLAESLAVAHEGGILHRDIKPNNVIVQDAGEDGPRAILIDFGIARTDVTPDGPIHTKVISGSPQYMAPEQLRGQASPASDVYSLGVVAFEMLSGKPFPNHSGDSSQTSSTLRALAEVRPRLPKALIRTLVRAVSYAPEQRFASGRAIERALRRSPPKRRRSGAVVGVSVSAGALAAGFLYYIGAIAPQQHSRPAPPPQELRSTVYLRSSSSRESSIPISPGRPLHAGDRLRIAFSPSADGYLYLFDQSMGKLQKQQINILFPGKDQNAFIAAGKIKTIPNSERDWLEFDGRADQERIWAVWAARPVAAFDALKQFSLPPYYGSLPPPSMEVVQMAVDRAFLTTSVAPIEGGIIWRSQMDILSGRLEFPVDNKRDSR